MKYSFLLIFLLILSCEDFKPYQEVVTCVVNNEIIIYETVRKNKNVYKTHISDWGTIVRNYYGRTIIEYSSGVQCSLEKIYN